MGPLQYLVIGYNHNHFRDYVLPELSSLTRRKVIRVIDIVFVTRDARGMVETKETTQAVPECEGLISSGKQDNLFESFTRDDIDMVGESLPSGTSVALVLFEHCWADRLEEEVHKANQYIGQGGSTAGDLAFNLEQRLASGTHVARDPV